MILFSVASIPKFLFNFLDICKKKLLVNFYLDISKSLFMFSDKINLNAKEADISIFGRRVMKKQ